MKLDFDIAELENERTAEEWRVEKHGIESYLEGMEWQANLTGSMFNYERGYANSLEELEAKYEEMLETIPSWQVGYLEHLRNAPDDDFWLFEEELHRVGVKNAKFLICEWLDEIKSTWIKGYRHSSEWLKINLGDEIWEKIGENIEGHLALMDKLASKKVNGFELCVNYYRSGFKTKEQIMAYADALMDSSFEYDQGYLAHVISTLIDGGVSYTFRDHMNSIDANGVLYTIKQYLKEFNIYG